MWQPLMVIGLVTIFGSGLNAASNKWHYRVHAMGMDIGYARVEDKGSKTCTVDKQKQCLSYRYSINLTHIEGIAGKIIAMIDVELYKKTLKPSLSYTRNKIGGKSSTISLVFDYNNNKFKHRSEGKTKEYDLPANAQTLDTIPFFLMNRGPVPAMHMNIYHEGSFKYHKMKFNTGAKKIHVYSGKEKYFTLKRDTRVPVFVRVLPLEVGGYTLGSVTASLIE